nr:biotin/lipoyl-containing protein [Pseudovibrio flavus]
MPSVVISITASVGDTVAKGDSLGEVEAMKMKNKIMAPCDGNVSAIHIAVGDRVKPGGLMFTIE